ncbi:hypothetical protein T440DRAFT_282342 [Plenodomus tracheiphilus IPT5]|uniref:BTB domain-containing protein n=1 Tax=Plenodomus tracheiphilus IPT5 TaxID=1408161 RepID=A0A6A7AS67_9PLEO|nr:hypothetical protein T440DRAFT_282342 [Plenodomus tracheiphilus IPT5]
MGPSRVAPLTSDQDSMTWPLTAFAITNEFKSTSRAELILDRANNEFGLIYALEPGTAVVAQFPDSDEPVYFAVSKIRAACLRTGTSCKKICILMAHFQLDLAFATGQGVSDFMQVLGRLITKVGNEHFEIYEAASNAALGRADFNMHKECYGLQSQGARQWMAVPDTNTSEWARIYKAGKCSDFTVIAGGTLFPVHRVLLCTRSEYFNAVCDGRFSETEQCSITLPEDAKTISTLLQELYEVYNPTTGSLFTNFALRRAFEKECIMSDLLSLFVTADKYGMSSVRQKTSEAIVDRLPFIHDPLSIVDLASNVYDVEFPAMDCGLRKVVVMQLHLRLSAIMNDEDAWKEYSDNKEVLKALHGYQCGMSGVGERTGLSTPPASPKKK